jgi:hypothetical protein
MSGDEDRYEPRESEGARWQDTSPKASVPNQGLELTASSLRSCVAWSEPCCYLGAHISPVKYISPLVSNNYRWGVEIPALHTVSNKPPHPLK